jgi:hypothetical protein
MIHKYNRLDGVPKGQYVLYKVLCFGDQGGSRYEDKILKWGSEDSLKDYCTEKSYRLDGSWREYFIKQRKE